MGILEELSLEQTWQEYLTYKTERQHLSKRELCQLQKFIQEKRYRTVTEGFADPEYRFEPPVKRSINKKGTEKKRVIYSFLPEENMVLKCMAFLLYRYDGVLADSCYSFRRSRSAKDAIRRITALPGIKKKTCLKVDVSDYFNSIPVPALCRILEEVVGEDDPELFSFLKGLLTTDAAYEQTREGPLLFESRGAMAGTPIAPFLANIYLRDLDVHFEKRKIPYFRYSDDILIFADGRQEAEKLLGFVGQFLSDKGLKINPDKVQISSPGQVWEFLGIQYAKGQIDLSENTRRKLKGKIRRKARAFYRWRIKNGVSYEQTARAFIKLFNAKFYDERDEKNFTWSRWFFPILTVDEGLGEMDAYLLEYIRYLSSGRHYKANYRISYEQIRQMGYKSLVHEYWSYRNTLRTSGMG